VGIVVVFRQGVERRVEDRDDGIRCADGAHGQVARANLDAVEIEVELAVA
jgi:hypothetical protein